MITPFNFWVSENATADYQHVPHPDATLHYIRVQDSAHILASVALRAYDKNDVINIFRDIDLFRIECAKKYWDTIPPENRVYKEAMHRGRDQHWGRLMSLVEAGDFTCTPVPPDAIMKVAWASNDTI